MLRFRGDSLAVNRPMTGVNLQEEWTRAMRYEPVIDDLGELVVFLLLVFLLMKHRVRGTVGEIERCTLLYGFSS